jgi:hypothetical protein
VEADPEIEAIQERMAKSSQIPPEEKGVVVDQKMVEINSDITELIEQIDEVKEEKHTVFIEKLKLYDERHTRKLKSAELTRDLQLKNVNELYDFEVQETTQVLRQETELLKHQLMNKLHDKIKKLEEIRDGVTEENRIATRKLRSKTRAHGDEPLSFALPSGSRKKPGGNYNTLSKNDLTLEENQIEEDLSAIYSEYKKTMTSYNSSNETGHSCDVRVENSILYLKDNKTLRKGSDVVVLDNLKGNEYFGDIISFASSEVRPATAILGFCAVVCARAIAVSQIFHHTASCHF